MSEEKTRRVEDLSAEEVAKHIRYWWGSPYLDLVKTLQAWKPAVAIKEVRAEEPQSHELSIAEIDGWIAEYRETPIISDTCPRCGLHQTRFAMYRAEMQAWEEAAKADYHCTFCDGHHHELDCPENCHKDAQIVTPAPAPATSADRCRRLADLLLKAFCCKNGCGWKTRSKCSAGLGRECECECHDAWACVDELVQGEAGR